MANPENQLASWYNSIPQFTRYWFTAAAVIPLAGKLGLLDLRNLILVWDQVWNHFHIWRPVTALFVTGVGFRFLLMLYMLYQYSSRLEKDEFGGKPADMGFMLMVVFATTVVVGVIMDLPTLFIIPIMAVIYIWCNRNKEVIVPFYFGIQLQAQYLPWVLCLFQMVVADGGVPELIGIFVGHVYYFFKFRYMDFGGPDLLKTPQWLQAYYPSVRGGRGGFGAPPVSPEGSSSSGGGGGFSAFGGRGRRLGD